MLLALFLILFQSHFLTSTHLLLFFTELIFIIVIRDFIKTHFSKFIEIIIIIMAIIKAIFNFNYNLSFFMFSIYRLEATEYYWHYYLFIINFLFKNYYFIIFTHFHFFPVNLYYYHLFNS